MRRDSERLADIIEAAEKISIRAGKGRHAFDADEDVLKEWYVDRFLTLRSTAFMDPKSYFHRYSKFTDAEATATATSIWTRINLVNLHENILPTRQRADLIAQAE